MLALTIKKKEAVVITTNQGKIKIILKECNLGRCLLVFEAPREIQILREKLVEEFPDDIGNK